MAAQGKCPDCRAAFFFAERRGFPVCPHCGAQLQQTTHEYSKGPWFSIGNARAAVLDAIAVPAALPRTAPELAATVRPLYYRVLQIEQATKRHAADLAYCARRAAELEARPTLADYDVRNLETFRAAIIEVNAKIAKAERDHERYSVKLAAAE